MEMNKKALILFLVGVSTAFCLGWIVHQPETLTIYNNTFQVVEVPVITVETVTMVETVEVPFPVIVYQNNTEIIYVPTPMPLRDFPNKKVLIAWMLNDKTDKLTYDVDRWDCMDFTLRTIRNAEIDGYKIYFLYEWIDDDTAHALCMAYVEQEAEYVVWEPQSDRIEWEWDSNQGG